MKHSLVILFLVAAFAAHADEMVASKGKDSVRLTPNPCPAEILAQIPEPLHAQFFAASAHFEGADYRACWTMRPDGMVFLKYEDGDGGLISREEFKRSPSI